jgi:CDP-diacylglycerol--glycerol-3-phosphate 3-phosphatidyltransferase/cardiolipin synthase
LLTGAGATDVLDGWYARRFGQATATGAVVDAVTDKIFVLSVVVTLLVQDRLGLVDLLLLSTREIGELPLVVWWVFSRAQRRRKSRAPMANVPGKLATTLQFAAIALVTANRPATVLVIVTAVVGVAAALVYWFRELSSHRLAQ